mgnify:CR=1 FL=1
MKHTDEQLYQLAIGFVLHHERDREPGKSEQFNLVDFMMSVDHVYEQLKEIERSNNEWFFHNI